MKIPSRDNYAEITTVCTLFGLSDPTELLPELENQLELVPDSVSALKDIVTGVGDARKSLSGGAKDISWEGEAAEAFSSKLDLGLDSLDALSTNMLDLLEAFDITPEKVQKFIEEFLDYLMIALGIAAGILILLASLGFGATVVVFAGGPAVSVLGIIAAVLGLIIAILALYKALNSDFPSISEFIAEMINDLLDLCEDERGKLDGPDGEPCGVDC